MKNILFVLALLSFSNNLFSKTAAVIAPIEPVVVQPTASVCTTEEYSNLQESMTSANMNTYAKNLGAVMTNTPISFLGSDVEKCKAKYRNGEKREIKDGDACSDFEKDPGYTCYSRWEWNPCWPWWKAYVCTCTNEGKFDCAWKNM